MITEQMTHPRLLSVFSLLSTLLMFTDLLNEALEKEWQWYDHCVVVFCIRPRDSNNCQMLSFHFVMYFPSKRGLDDETRGLLPSATSVLLMLSVQLFMLKRLYSQSLDCLPRIYTKHMLAIKTINTGQKTLWTGEKRPFVEGSVKSKDFRSILWNSSESKSNLCGNVGIGKGAHQHKSEKAI